MRKTLSCKGRVILKYMYQSLKSQEDALFGVDNIAVPCMPGCDTGCTCLHRQNILLSKFRDYLNLSGCDLESDLVQKGGEECWGCEPWQEQR